MCEGCRADLQIPALLQMKRLEPAPAACEEDLPRAAATPLQWGIYEGFAFLGVVIVLVAVAVGSWLHYIRPVARTAPPEELIREKAENASPRQLWRTWRIMRVKGLNPLPIQQIATFDQSNRRHMIWMGSVAVVGLFGLSLTIWMLALRNRQPMSRA